MALCSLLGRSSTWRVEGLWLEGGVGGRTWDGLGRLVARGRLGSVSTGREVVGRGRREEVRAELGRGDCWMGSLWRGRAVGRRGGGGLTGS